MDPNKALAGVLMSLGLVVLIVVLGLAGALPFHESARDDSNETTRSSSVPSGSLDGSENISLPSGQASSSNPPSIQPAPSPAPTPAPQPAPVPAPVSPAPQSTPASAPAQKAPPGSVSAPTDEAGTPAPAPSPSPVPPPAAPVRSPRRGLPEIGYYTFDKAESGALPSGWTQLRGSWQAMDDKVALPGLGSNVVRQLEIPKENADAIVLSNDSIMRNVKASVNVRISDARTNQTAGLVFRFQDPAHYYSVGLDTRDQKVVLFKTVAGTMRIISYASTNRIRANEWNYLEVSATGEHIKVRLNDNDYFSVKDSAFDEGKTGMWTLGSTDSKFDNAQVKKLP